MASSVCFGQRILDPQKGNGWGTGMNYQRQCAQKSTRGVKTVLFRHIERDS